MEPIRVFEKYEVIRRIAQGGMGEIFLARQTGIAGFDRLAILKSLLPELKEQPDLLDQFLNEARIAATLNHPNIVAIYEIGEWEDIYFLAMEYIAGEALSGLQRAATMAQTSIPWHISARVIRDTLLGADHAHFATDTMGSPLNIIHRDMTPQNIMVRLDGVVKIVDFGVAKAAGSDSKTQHGEVKGKLAYLSREQIEGVELDHRSDQFSLGIVLWELVTGRRLFNANNPIEVFKRIIDHDIPAPRSIVPSVPEPLEDVVMKMLADKPEDRYARCKDAAIGLTKWLESLPGNVGTVADFVSGLVGDDVKARSDDLTPGDVAIQGLTERYVNCRMCKARMRKKSKFCDSCGTPQEETGLVDNAAEAAVALAPRPTPVPTPSPAAPAGVDALLGLAPPAADGADATQVIDTTPVKNAVLLSDAGAAPAEAAPFADIGVTDVDQTPPPASSSGLDTANQAAAEPELPKKPPAPRAFVGRTNELSNAGALVREASTGNVRAAVFSGEHGMGKTELLRRCFNFAKAAQLKVLKARGRGLGPSQPLDVVRQLLRGLCEGDCSDEALDALLAGLGLPEPDFKRVQRALFGKGSEVPDLSREYRHLLDETALLQVFALAAKERGLCLLIDDIDAADLWSIALLGALARRSEMGKIALIATAGRRFEHSSLPIVELSPVTPDDVFQLGQLLLGGSGLPNTAVMPVVERAAGNPGFAAELIEKMRDEQAIQEIGGRWMATPALESIDLPRSPTQAATKLILSLDAGTQVFIKTAAQVGWDFSIEMVGFACRPKVDLAQVIEAGAASGILEPVPDDSRRFRFTRGLYPDVARNITDPAEAQLIHRRVAEAIEQHAADAEAAVPQIAAHLLYANAPKKLATRGLAAARMKIAEGALEEASAYYLPTVSAWLDVARERSGDTTYLYEVFDVVTEAAVALRHVHPNEVSQLLLRATRLIPENMVELRPRKAELMRQQGLCWIEVKRWDDAEKILDEALETVTPEQDPELVADVLGDFATVMAAKGDAVGARMQLEQAVQLIPEHPDRAGLGARRGAQLGNVLVDLDPAQALRALQRAYLHAQADDDAENEVATLIETGRALGRLGRTDDALRALEDVRNQATARYDRLVLARVHYRLGEVRALAQDRAGARDELLRGVRFAEEVGAGELTSQLRQALRLVASPGTG